VFLVANIARYTYLFWLLCYWKPDSLLIHVTAMSGSNVDVVYVSSYLFSKFSFFADLEAFFSFTNCFHNLVKNF